MNINGINFVPRQLRLLFISVVSVMVLSGCGDDNTSLGTPTPPAPPTPPPPVTPPTPMVACASYTNGNGTTLTAMAARTTEAPNCVYEATFVDHGTPLTASLTLANLDFGGAHVFSGSLVVGADSATLAGVPAAAVVLTIEPGTTIAFANAANRVIVNRGAQIMAAGTAANPITFTSMADVGALATTDTADDLAATATDQWAGITINGAALNIACTYVTNQPGVLRRFSTDPFVLTDPQPTLTAPPAQPPGSDPFALPEETCSLGAAVFTAGATDDDAATLADGFHGGASPADNSGVLDYVIIKHVGDAAVDATTTPATPVNRNALHLRSVGTATSLSNIEVYSVDGSGIQIDGGSANLSNVLVYNPQTHGVHATDGYFGLLDTVLVSQADDAGENCVLVESPPGPAGAPASDGMNTKVTARNLTCDVSAGNEDGAGVIVFNTQARLQNAIIVGSRVAANDTAANDNACLDIVGGSPLPGAPGTPPTTVSLEVDGVITSCLEESEIVTAGNFLATNRIGGPPDNRLIATNTDVRPFTGLGDDPRPAALAMDIQFHARVVPFDANGNVLPSIPTVSPLADPNTRLVLLSDVGTLEARTLFSLPLSASSVNDALTTVAASGATVVTRTYLGAIAAGTGNNPFSGWTFGVFGTPPTPPEPPPPPPTVACASYTNSAGDELTAMAARTAAAPNCVYEASFVDNETPLTANLRLANLDAGGAHVFSGSLVVGADSATLAGVPSNSVVLTIAAGATIAFANAADRVIVNRGARIEAVGTAAAPITFTSLADVEALASDDPADDLAATATDQWGGITINGQTFNNACTYQDLSPGTARRAFMANDPFRISVNRGLTVGNCSLGGAVFTAGATAADPATLAYGFHGGNTRLDDSGELAYVIIKHVGDAAVDATTTEPVNRNALNLRSVGSNTRLNNIEVYSVDGTGIAIDGGYNPSVAGSSLSNVLVYNAQEHGVSLTGGYLGIFNGVLVSQAEGAGEACIQVDAGAGGMSAAEITDGMNTRVTVRNLTCDVSADNANGAGVVVTEGARARFQNAVIVGSRVAADDTAAIDNVCLRLVGDRSFIEANGVIASCLEASTVVTAANFLSADSPGDRVIATNATTPTADEVAMDIQFHDPGAATTISPLAGTDPGLVALSAVGTIGARALFSELLSASMVDAAATTVVAFSNRTYLGAITPGTNPFSGWTFGVFTPPPSAALLTCASYTGSAGIATAAAAPTAAAPNCVYEAGFVDNATPLTRNITLANLDEGGVHVFNGSLVVGADSATIAGVPSNAVVLTIEAGATIAFENAADRLIINRGAQISAIGTADDPITFTSLADVQALASADPADDLAATATDQWGGITINGRSLNNACTYAVRDADAATGIVPPRRPLEANNFTPSSIPSLTVEGECSEGGAVFTAATTAGDDPTLADGFHGGASSRESSGRLDFVIIKHVGDAATGVNRNALHLRSVGGGTDLRNIEVYSVDGTGIRIDGGFNTSGAVPYLANALIYNAQEHGIHATGGFLGRFDGVLVSQADGTGAACIQADSGAGGMTADQITDGMNTRVRAQNLTCDVSADNAGGAGVVVTEGARALVENAIIVGSEVAADDTAAIDNVCLRLVGDRSIIEADGVIASCLEASTVVTAANFLSADSPGDRVIATNAATPTADEVARDIQFHTPGAATTISPLAGTDPGLVLLFAEGTLEARALFSEFLSASMVDGATTTVVVSPSAGSSFRPYLGAIASGTGNNPFFGWTFGVFTPPVPPSEAALLTCASYTSSIGVMTARGAPTTEAPNCVYEASFVDNETPLTASITLANLVSGGAHVFSGSLVVGEGSTTLAGVARAARAAVVLTIEAGATIAFANADDRVIVNRGAQIEAVGTATNPITFTSLADVQALASTDTADDLAATATDQWAGITINGQSLNNACTYSDPSGSRRGFTADPFTLADPQPDLTATACSQGAGVLTADGFHGGTSPTDDSGSLAFVIIKHVGDAAVDATTSAPVNRNALNLRSVGAGTTLGNIEVYSVDGTGVAIDGGGADLSNVLVYNPQEHGVHTTGGYLGLLDTVLVSQADGTGDSCVQVEAGAAGESADAITDGMNTRVTARNLTCDVSADNAGGAGVIVTEGARARIQNAIIVGSRVAVNDTAANDNVCLELVGDRAIIEVDGVIASCLEVSTIVTVANFMTATSPGNRVIATDTTPDHVFESRLVVGDIQFQGPDLSGATTVSPLAGTDTGFVVLSNTNTLDGRALFSESVGTNVSVPGTSVVNDAPALVMTSIAAEAAGGGFRNYLGAIAAGGGNNPFFGWTFGIFVTAP